MKILNNLHFTPCICSQCSTLYARLSCPIRHNVKCPIKMIFRALIVITEDKILDILIFEISIGVPSPNPTKKNISKLLYLLQSTTTTVTTTATLNKKFEKCPTS